MLIYIWPCIFWVDNHNSDRTLICIFMFTNINTVRYQTSHSKLQLCTVDVSFSKSGLRTKCYKWGFPWVFSHSKQILVFWLWIGTSYTVFQIKNFTVLVHNLFMWSSTLNKTAVNHYYVWCSKPLVLFLFLLCSMSTKMVYRCYHLY